MTLRELLAERQAPVVGRWLDAILDEYGPETAARWRRNRDPLTNPTGHALTSGLPRLFGSVAGEGEPAADAVAALEAIVKIRSVQEFTPSRAVGFVYRLREAIREELAPDLADGAHAAELADLDGRIERLALLAFDAYVRCRDQVFRLRQDELKRSVASLLRRWHGGELPEPAPDVVQLNRPAGPGMGR